jgi:hypothetical protein
MTEFSAKLQIFNHSLALPPPRWSPQLPTCEREVKKNEQRECEFLLLVFVSPL